MQKWEYKILFRTRTWKDEERGASYRWPSEWQAWFEDGSELHLPVDMTAKLKELGQQGWELVSVFPLSSVVGGDTRNAMVRDFAGYTTDEKWVFKRLIE